MKSKLPACFFISLALFERDDFVCSKAKRVVFLVGRSGEDDNMGPEGMGEFHSHVAQSAETDDANFLALRRHPNGACGE